MARAAGKALRALGNAAQAAGETVADAGDGKWSPELHPRDKKGRFRDTWGMSPAARAKVKRILDGFDHAWMRNEKLRSDDHASNWLTNFRRASTKKRTPAQNAAIESFNTPEGNEEIQSTLRSGTHFDDDPRIKQLDEAMEPLPEDMLLTRVVGPEAFGVDAANMDGVDEWTGKLFMDLGYSPTNVGSPHPVSTPHVTLSMVVPRGTPAIIAGDGSRKVTLDRQLPARITRVEDDGKGGKYVYAVVMPKQGNKESPRALGKKLGPREISPAEEAIPEAFERRGLDPETGLPIKKALPPAPVKQAMTPQGTAKAIKKAGQAVPRGAGRPTREEDIVDAEVIEEAPSPSTRGLPPAPRPRLTAAERRAQLVERQRIADENRMGHQAVAQRHPIALAVTDIDEITAKGGDDQTMARYIRARSMGPEVEQIRDERMRGLIRDELENAAKEIEDGNRQQGQNRIQRMVRAMGIQTHGSAGRDEPFDPVTMRTTGEPPEAGTPVRVIRPGTSFIREGRPGERGAGDIIPLERALVTTARGGALGAPLNAPERPTAAKVARQGLPQTGTELPNFRQVMADLSTSRAQEALRRARLSSIRGRDRAAIARDLRDAANDIDNDQISADEINHLPGRNLSERYAYDRAELDAVADRDAKVLRDAADKLEGAVTPEAPQAETPAPVAPTRLEVPDYRTVDRSLASARSRGALRDAQRALGQQEDPRLVAEDLRRSAEDLRDGEPLDRDEVGSRGDLSPDDLRDIAVADANILDRAADSIEQLQAPGESPTQGGTRITGMDEATKQAILDRAAGIPRDSDNPENQRLLNLADQIRAERGGDDPDAVRQISRVATPTQALPVGRTTRILPRSVKPGDMVEGVEVGEVTRQGTLIDRDGNRIDVTPDENGRIDVVRAPRIGKATKAAVPVKATRAPRAKAAPAKAARRRVVDIDPDVVRDRLVNAPNADARYEALQELTEGASDARVKKLGRDLGTRGTARMSRDEVIADLMARFDTLASVKDLIPEGRRRTEIAKRATPTVKAAKAAAPQVEAPPAPTVKAAKAAVKKATPEVAKKAVPAAPAKAVKKAVPTATPEVEAPVTARPSREEVAGKVARAQEQDRVLGYLISGRGTIDAEALSPQGRRNILDMDERLTPESLTPEGSPTGFGRNRRIRDLADRIRALEGTPPVKKATKAAKKVAPVKAAKATKAVKATPGPEQASRDELKALGYKPNQSTVDIEARRELAEAKTTAQINELAAKYGVRFPTGVGRRDDRKAFLEKAITRRPRESDDAYRARVGKTGGTPPSKGRPSVTTRADLPENLREILESLDDFDNPPSRDEARERLGGLSRSDLLQMARVDNVSRATTLKRDDLVERLVESTVGRRLDSIAIRGFKGRRPGMIEAPSRKKVSPATKSARGGVITERAEKVAKKAAKTPSKKVVKKATPVATPSPGEPPVVRNTRMQRITEQVGRIGSPEYERNRRAAGLLRGVSPSEVAEALVDRQDARIHRIVELRRQFDGEDGVLEAATAVRKRLAGKRPQFQRDRDILDDAKHIEGERRQRARTERQMLRGGRQSAEGTHVFIGRARTNPRTGRRERQVRDNFPGGERTTWAEEGSPLWDRALNKRTSSWTPDDTRSKAPKPPAPVAQTGAAHDVRSLIDGLGFDGTDVDDERFLNRIQEALNGGEPPRVVARRERASLNMAGSPFHRAIITEQVGDNRRFGEADQQYAARLAAHDAEAARLRVIGNRRLDLLERLGQLRRVPVKKATPAPAKKAAKAAKAAPTPAPVKKAAAKAPVRVPSKATRTKEAPDYKALARQVEASSSVDEAQEMLKDLTIPQLRQFAKDNELPTMGRRRDDIRDSIVRLLVGARLNSEAIGRAVDRAHQKRNDDDGGRVVDIAELRKSAKRATKAAKVATGDAKVIPFKRLGKKTSPAGEPRRPGTVSQAVPRRPGTVAGTPLEPGQSIAATYIRPGHRVMVLRNDNGDFVRTGRVTGDVRPITVDRVESVDMGRQRGYRIHGTDDDGNKVSTIDYFGQNTFKAAPPRGEKVRSTAPRRVSNKEQRVANAETLERLYDENPEVGRWRGGSEQRFYTTQLRNGTAPETIAAKVRDTAQHIRRQYPGERDSADALDRVANGMQELGDSQLATKTAKKAAKAAPEAPIPPVRRSNPPELGGEGPNGPAAWLVMMRNAPDPKGPFATSDDIGPGRWVYSPSGGGWARIVRQNRVRGRDTYDILFARSSGGGPGQYTNNYPVDQIRGWAERFEQQQAAANRRIDAGAGPDGGWVPEVPSVAKKAPGAKAIKKVATVAPESATDGSFAPGDPEVNGRLHDELAARTLRDLRGVSDELGIKLPVGMRDRKAVANHMIRSMRAFGQHDSEEEFESDFRNALRAVDSRKDPGDVDAMEAKIRQAVADGMDEDGFIKLVSSDNGVTAAKTRKLAERLGVDIPESAKHVNSVKGELARALSKRAKKVATPAVSKKADEAVTPGGRREVTKPEGLVKAYVAGASVREIAEASGHSEAQVRNSLKKSGIQMRARGGITRRPNLDAPEVRRRDREKTRALDALRPQGSEPPAKKVAPAKVVKAAKKVAPPAPNIDRMTKEQLHEEIQRRKNLGEDLPATQNDFTRDELKKVLRGESVTLSGTRRRAEAAQRAAVKAAKAATAPARKQLPRLSGDEAIGRLSEAMSVDEIKDTVARLRSRDSLNNARTRLGMPPLSVGDSLAKGRRELADRFTPSPGEAFPGESAPGIRRITSAELDAMDMQGIIDARNSGQIGRPEAVKRLRTLAEREARTAEAPEAAPAPRKAAPATELPDIPRRAADRLRSISRSGTPGDRRFIQMPEANSGLPETARRRGDLQDLLNAGYLGRAGRSRTLFVTPAGEAWIARDRGDVNAPEVNAPDVNAPEAPVAKKATKAATPARVLEPGDEALLTQNRDLSQEDFKALPEDERARLEAAARAVVGTGRQESYTIPSNRTSMGTTIRGLRDAPEVVQARAMLARWYKPAPRDESPGARAARIRDEATKSGHVSLAGYYRKQDLFDIAEAGGWDSGPRWQGMPDLHSSGLTVDKIADRLARRIEMDLGIERSGKKKAAKKAAKSVAVGPTDDDAMVRGLRTLARGTTPEERAGLPARENDDPITNPIVTRNANSIDAIAAVDTIPDGTLIRTAYPRGGDPTQGWVIAQGRVTGRNGETLRVEVTEHGEDPSLVGKTMGWSGRFVEVVPTSRTTIAKKAQSATPVRDRTKSTINGQYPYQHARAMFGLGSVEEFEDYLDRHKFTKTELAEIRSQEWFANPLHRDDPFKLDRDSARFYTAPELRQRLIDAHRERLERRAAVTDRQRESAAMLDELAAGWPDDAAGRNAKRAASRTADALREGFADEYGASNALKAATAGYGNENRHLTSAARRMSERAAQDTTAPSTSTVTKKAGRAAKALESLEAKGRAPREGAAPETTPGATAPTRVARGLYPGEGLPTGPRMAAQVALGTEGRKHLAALDTAIRMDRRHSEVPDLMAQVDRDLELAGEGENSRSRKGMREWFNEHFPEGGVAPRRPGTIAPTKKAAKKVAAPAKAAKKVAAPKVAKKAAPAASGRTTVADLRRQSALDAARTHEVMGEGSVPSADIIRRLEAGDMTPAAARRRALDSEKYWRLQARDARGLGRTTPARRRKIEDDRNGIADKYRNLADAIQESQTAERISEARKRTATPAKTVKKAAPAAAAPRPKGAKRVASLDPLSIYMEGGESGLRERLSTLDLEQLRDVVADYDLDLSRQATRWRSRDRLTKLIVDRIKDRSTKGQAFRPPVKKTAGRAAAPEVTGEKRRTFREMRQTAGARDLDLRPSTFEADRARDRFDRGEDPREIAADLRRQARRIGTMRPTNDDSGRRIDSDSDSLREMARSDSRKLLALADEISPRDVKKAAKAPAKKAASLAGGESATPVKATVRRARKLTPRSLREGDELIWEPEGEPPTRGQVVKARVTSLATGRKVTKTYVNWEGGRREAIETDKDLENVRRAEAPAPAKKVAKAAKKVAPEAPEAPAPVKATKATAPRKLTPASLKEGDELEWTDTDGTTLHGRVVKVPSKTGKTTRTYVDWDDERRELATTRSLQNVRRVNAPEAPVKKATKAAKKAAPAEREVSTEELRLRYQAAVRRRNEAFERDGQEGWNRESPKVDELGKELAARAAVDEANRKALEANAPSTGSDAADNAVDAIARNIRSSGQTGQTYRIREWLNRLDSPDQRRRLAARLGMDVSNVPDADLHRFIDDVLHGRQFWPQPKAAKKKATPDVPGLGRTPGEGDDLDAITRKPELLALARQEGLVEIERGRGRTRKLDEGWTMPYLRKAIREHRARKQSGEPPAGGTTQAPTEALREMAPPPGGMVSGARSSTPLIENTWGDFGRGEIGFHADGAIGTALRNMRDDRLMDVDGQPLGNVLGRIATDAVRGRLTSQEQLDKLKALRDRLPEGSAARSALDRAIKDLDAPARSIDLPVGTPAPLRALAEELSRIPLARKREMGHGFLPHDDDKSELDRLQELIEDWLNGRTSALFLSEDLRRRLHNKRHESQEGKLEIDRAVLKASKELEEMRRDVARRGELRPPKA